MTELKGGLPPMCIRADTSDFERGLKKAKKANEDWLTIALKTWKERKRQQQAWQYPPEVEEQMRAKSPNGGTLLGLPVVSVIEEDDA